MTKSLEQLKEKIFSNSEKVAAYQSILSGKAAIGPENGGQGEIEKALYIESLFSSSNFKLQRYDAPDKRVQSALRPNLIARRPGLGAETLWLFAHMDVVPAGDPQSWHSDPWTIRREGDLLYGRGVEDNQQAICSMLLLADSLRETGIQTKYGLGLVFMADEESGSEYGLKWILEKTPHIFAPDDMYIVPDSGSPDGSEIEIAEKAQLWLKFTVTGRQCHASNPQCGKNSLLGASRLIIALQKLHDLFPQQNSLFIPPCSTFTVSRHEENVGAINILPGKDVFYMDCRILPGISLSGVYQACESICESIGRELDLKIQMETVHKQAATMLPEDSPVIGGLKRAIFKVYGVRARAVGIGGATVAAMLREKGLPAVVWSCILNTCHQPDERSSILATCRDAAVFAELLMRGQDQAC